MKESNNLQEHRRNIKYMRALKAAFPHTIPIFAGFWFLGLGLSLICLLAFGQDSFMIPAMIAILSVLTLLRAPIEKGGEAK